MGVALSHLGLLSSICRPRRLRGGATPTADREVPLSQGRTVRYATRPKTPAQLIRATRRPDATIRSSACLWKINRLDQTRIVIKGIDPAEETECAMPAGPN
jgi:hypothetical protein